MKRLFVLVAAIIVFASTSGITFAEEKTEVAKVERVASFTGSAPMLGIAMIDAKLAANKWLKENSGNVEIVDRQVSVVSTVEKNSLRRVEVVITFFYLAPAAQEKAEPKPAAPEQK